MGQIRVVRGSVVEYEADALVNAANTGMRGGGGVDGAFHNRCGHKLYESLVKACPRGSRTAEVVVTPAPNLAAKHIFHVAGPVWQGGGANEEEELSACYENCVWEAQERGLSSIAFPSISTGVYGFPLERAARIALSSVIDAVGPSDLDVTFVMYGRLEHDIFEAELRKQIKERA